MLLVAIFGRNKGAFLAIVVVRCSFVVRQLAIFVALLCLFKMGKMKVWT